MKVLFGNEYIKQAVQEANRPDGQNMKKSSFIDLYQQSVDTVSEQTDIKMRHPVMNDMFEFSITESTPLKKEDILDRIEHTLAILDEFQMKLSDSQVPLKTLSPLIDQLSAQNNFLGAILESLSEGDDLREILNQAFIMSSLEVIKFNRGDYI